MTESDSHDDCCDINIDFLKEKGIKNKSNILFEASSNDNDSTGNMSGNKYDLENLNQAEKEHICLDFKKKVQEANYSKDKARTMLLGQQWF